MHVCIIDACLESSGGTDSAMQSSMQSLTCMPRRATPAWKYSLSKKSKWSCIAVPRESRIRGKLPPPPQRCCSSIAMTAVLLSTNGGESTPRFHASSRTSSPAPAPKSELSNKTAGQTSSFDNVVHGERFLVRSSLFDHDSTRTLVKSRT